MTRLDRQVRREPAPTGRQRGSQVAGREELVAAQVRVLREVLGVAARELRLVDGVQLCALLVDLCRRPDC